MSAEPSIPSSSVSDSTQGIWDRISDFASRNRRTILYTVGATTVLVTAGGVWYYYQLQSQKDETTEKKKKSKKRKQKQQSQQGASDEESQVQSSPGTGSSWVVGANEEEKKTTVEDEDSLPEISEDSLNALPLEVVSTLEFMPIKSQTRKEYALQFKNAGNKTYSARKFKDALDLYTKAIMCDPDPVFYSNRAACPSLLEGRLT